MQVDQLEPKHPNDRCWLSQPANDTRPPLRHTSLGSSRDGQRCSISFDGLTEKELHAFEAFEIGESYLRVLNGRLHAYSAREPLPTPEEDPILGPHWTGGAVKEWGGLPSEEGWHSPGIIITGLGAGSGSVEGRLRSQQIVTECGFVCLRSPRGEDGKYWEQWVLHFMLAARGPLKEHLDRWKEAFAGHPEWHAEAEEAARFLTRDLGVHYGSLDITIQRWVLSYD